MYVRCLAFLQSQKEPGFTQNFCWNSLTMSCWSWNRSSDCSLPSIEPCNFLSKQRIRRKLVSQRRQKFARMLIVVLAHVCNREQDVRERRKIVSAVGDQL